MSGTVRELSAMLVLRMIFLWLAGRMSKMAWCSSQGMLEWRGMQHHSGPLLLSPPSSAIRNSLTRWISWIPGRKTRTAPASFRRFSFGSFSFSFSSRSSSFSRSDLHILTALSDMAGLPGSKALSSSTVLGYLWDRSLARYTQ